MEQQNEWKSLSHQEKYVFKQEYIRKSSKLKKEREYGSNFRETLSSDDASETFLKPDFDYDAESFKYRLSTLDNKSL